MAKNGTVVVDAPYVRYLQAEGRVRVLAGQSRWNTALRIYFAEDEDQEPTKVYDCSNERTLIEVGVRWLQQNHPHTFADLAAARFHGFTIDAAKGSMNWRHFNSRCVK